MDWRILTAITIICWGGYGVLLKLVGDRLAWQASMLVFVLSYAAVLVIFCMFYGELAPTKVLIKPAWLSLGAGVLCGLGAITYFKAIPMANGGIFFPLVALSVLVSGIACFVFLREPFSFRAGLGILFAIAAIVLLSK